MTTPKATAAELADELHRAAREQRVTGHVTSYSSETLDHFAAELTRLAEVEKALRRLVAWNEARQRYGARGYVLSTEHQQNVFRLDAERIAAFEAARSALSSTADKGELDD